MMVESRRTVNPLHWKHCRFDSCLTHCRVCDALRTKRADVSFFVLSPFFSAARISRYSLNGKTADLYPAVIRSTRIAGFATIQMTGTSDAVAFVYLTSAEKASGFRIMRLLAVTKTYPCGNENGTGVSRWISRVKYMATFMLETTI